MIIGIVFASTLLTITALVISQKIFIRRNITDKINQRSSHSVTATRNWGIAVFTSIFCISAFYYLNGIVTLFRYLFATSFISSLLSLTVGLGNSLIPLLLIWISYAWDKTYDLYNENIINNAFCSLNR